MARLFTVVIAAITDTDGRDFSTFTTYEADFAGLHFSRRNEADVIKWVRVAAKARYGKDTQVIFLHEERPES